MESNNFDCKAASCVGWWKANGILPIAFSGAQVDCEGRWLEIHLHEKGLWSCSLLIRNGAFPEEVYTFATNPEEIKDANTLAAHVMSCVEGLSFEDMQESIVEIMCQAQSAEVAYDKFHPDHPENPNKGWWGLASWDTPRPFYLYEKFHHGGLKFTFPTHVFIPILLQRFGLTEAK